MYKLISLAVVILLASACGKEVAETVERVRAVKTVMVAERASGQLRKFPGTVEPVDTTLRLSLSQRKNSLKASPLSMYAPGSSETIC